MANDYIGLLEISNNASKTGKKLKTEELKLLDILYEININDYKAVLKTAEGRRVLWRLLRQTQFYNHMFIGNSEAFFREGLQYIGAIIHNNTTTAGGGHAILDVLQKEEENLFKFEVEKLFEQMRRDNNE